MKSKMQKLCEKDTLLRLKNELEFDTSLSKKQTAGKVPIQRHNEAKNINSVVFRFLKRFGFTGKKGFAIVFFTKKVSHC